MVSMFEFRVRMLDEVPLVIGSSSYSHCDEIPDSQASHAMLVDQVTENTVVPLNANLATDGRLELANSVFA